MTHLLVFCSGAAIELFCVGWVHFSERDEALLTAVCSMGIAIAQVLGIGEAIHGGYDALAFVAGYGCGTALAVKGKAWLKQKRLGASGS